MRAIPDAGRGVQGGRGQRAEGNPSPLVPSVHKYAISRHLDSLLTATKSQDTTSGFGHTCEREFLTIQCLKCGHQHRVPTGSRDRTCPACSKEIYSDIYDRYQEMIGFRKNLKFLTLTWKPVKHQEAKIVREMGKALVKLLHRKPYRKVWKGLLATIECKKTPHNMFYYHIHCILEGDYVPQAQISKDWREISGFPVVFIERIWRTPKRALRYVMKYILKGFTFEEPRDVQDFKESMSGVHYIRSYGEFYNSEYKKGAHVYFPCPECGAVKSWIILEFWSPVDCYQDEPYYADSGG